MGVRARLRAVCVVANPRNSQAIAVVCALQPIPNRIPHTFIRDHEHVLRGGNNTGHECCECIASALPARTARECLPALAGRAGWCACGAAVIARGGAPYAQGISAAAVCPGIGRQQRGLDAGGHGAAMRQTVPPGTGGAPEGAQGRQARHDQQAHAKCQQGLAQRVGWHRQFHALHLVPDGLDLTDEGGHGRAPEVMP